MKADGNALVIVARSRQICLLETAANALEEACIPSVLEAEVFPSLGLSPSIVGGLAQCWALRVKQETAAEAARIISELPFDLPPVDPSEP